MGLAHRVSLAFPARVIDARLRTLQGIPTQEDAKETAAREDRLRCEGTAAERAKLAPALAALAAASARLEGSAASLEERTKQQMVELVKAIVVEVLRREVAEGRYDLGSIVREGLRAARGVERGVVVRLHPQDYDAANAGGALAALANPTIQFQSDASVARAGCKVETPYGEVVRDLGAIVADVFAAVEGKR
jgi:flagellar biosynthesis/type III secretory pathway protein FliH